MRSGYRLFNSFHTLGPNATVNNTKWKYCSIYSFQFNGRTWTLGLPPQTCKLEPYLSHNLMLSRIAEKVKQIQGFDIGLSCTSAKLIFLSGPITRNFQPFLVFRISGLSNSWSRSVLSCMVCEESKQLNCRGL